MTIKFHGTPINPKSEAMKMVGENFCVSFYDPRQADLALAIGQIVLWDNGAFTLHTQKIAIDEAKLFRWLEPRLYHPHRAIVLDRIGGSVDEQREMIARWPFARELSWPVWHLDKPLDYLDELADAWPAVCLGSAGAYWQIGSAHWERKMDEAFEHLAKRRVMPWIHGLRMLGQLNRRWPLASADSTNVAQNWRRDTGCAPCKAKQINASQSPRSFTEAQGTLL